MLVTERNCDIHQTAHSQSKKNRAITSHKLLLLTIPKNMTGTPASEFENALPSLPGVEIDFERDLDLCPQAHQRLMKFMEHGVSPSNRQNTASSEES